MTLVDRVIASLRDQHDRLAALVSTLDEAALTSPSGAAEWRVCDVLSHLGSGAEIGLRPIAAAAAGAEAPPAENQAVWDRWNAMSPGDQAAGFVLHDARLVETLEAIDDDARGRLTVDLGFLPAPVPLEMAAGMRLNEVALHAWDVEVGFDRGATVDDQAALVLLELMTGSMGVMLPFMSRPAELGERAVVALEGHGLVVDEEVALIAEAPVAATATFAGPPEAAVRLFAGRLGPDVTPATVEVTGNVTLDGLRAVFPGF